MKTQKRQTINGEAAILNVRIPQLLYERICEKAYNEHKSIALVTAEMLQQALEKNNGVNKTKK